jgi:hypothetical protein
VSSVISVTVWVFPLPPPYKGQIRYYNRVLAVAEMFRDSKGNKNCCYSNHHASQYAKEARQLLVASLPVVCNCIAFALLLLLLNIVCNLQ